MKKLINKLFERLGYVPKSVYKDAEEIRHNINVMDREIRLGINEYQIFEGTNEFFVTAYSNSLGRHRIIKVFRTSNTEDSSDYARICAEELCEKLNERL